MVNIILSILQLTWNPSSGDWNGREILSADLLKTYGMVCAIGTGTVLLSIGDSGMTYPFALDKSKIYLYNL